MNEVISFTQYSIDGTFNRQSNHMSPKNIPKIDELMKRKDNVMSNKIKMAKKQKAHTR